jgi:hypothetical protein
MTGSNEILPHMKGEIKRGLENKPISTYELLHKERELMA